VQFTGIAILVLGFSNFIWVPLSESFGRRPVLIFSTLICTGSAIWRARATTYGSFMGACVLNGLGAGPAETQQPAIIADIIFLHDRGKYNTLYFAFYFGSLMVGPIIAGPMSQAVGWRNFWWLNVALNAFTTICCVFLFPETKYRRTFVSDNVQTLPTGQMLVDEGSYEKVSGPMQDEGTNNPRIMRDPSNPLATQDTNPNNLRVVKTHEDPSLGTGRPSKQQWRLFQPYQGGLIREFLLPWYLCLFPIVEFAAFNVSWTASSFLTLNLTQTQAFASPPYNLSNQTIGFFNFAILIGAAIGLLTAGPLSDYVAAKLTERNRGIREPEMRLLAAVPYVIIMVIGNVIVAVGYQYAWSWKVIVIIGYTATGIQVAALPSIFSTYAVDSYKPVAGSLFVAITVNKNVWGYGFSKFITPWIIKAGYIPPIMTNMALILLWCLFGILFWFYGKTFRKWTRHSKVHLM